MAETKKILLPDLGDFPDIEIIEILVNPGEVIEAEQSIIVLESDKATMEIPSPYAGKIKALSVVVGDRLNQGDALATLELIEAAPEAAAEAEPVEAPAAPPSENQSENQTASEEATRSAAAVPPSEAALGRNRRPHPGAAETPIASAGRDVHASPSVRRYARELGVNLEKIVGTGTKGRILKPDVTAFIKASMSSASSAGSGLSVGSIPDVDHSKFGEVESKPLSRIQKLSGAHLHRSWVNVPHVTQFDEADITELEAFRKSLAKDAEKKSVRLTALVFLMKAVVSAMRENPNFNASLDSSGENLILKKYFHIGVAVDTPKGLVVPVVRDVDQKGLFDLAGELGDLAERARNGKLSPADMQGGCFTISSLGGIGGTQFTPIVNAPEVAILGVARSKMQPVYENGKFEPRLILPLALSYDHRVIDGAQGARFTRFLSEVISDIRRVLL